MHGPLNPYSFSRIKDYTMLLVFVLFGWSCGSNEPTKQPLRRVDAASVQAAKIPDNGTATHKTLDAHADTPKPRADTDGISWSRMVPIDPVRASKGVVLVDSIRFAIVDCGAVISDHRIHEATKPNRKMARQLKKQCMKLSGINQDDVLSGAGISLSWTLCC